MFKPSAVAFAAVLICFTAPSFACLKTDISGKYRAQSGSILEIKQVNCSIIKIYDSQEDHTWVLNINDENSSVPTKFPKKFMERVKADNPEGEKLFDNTILMVRKIMVNGFEALEISATSAIPVEGKKYGIKDLLLNVEIVMHVSLFINSPTNPGVPNELFLSAHSAKITSVKYGDGSLFANDDVFTLGANIIFDAFKHSLNTSLESVL